MFFIEFEDQICFAKQHKDFLPSVIRDVLNQDKALVDSQATIESRKLFNMARQVMSDIHRLKSFMRLEISKHGILYGKVETEHKIEKSIIEHFMERFPLFFIAIKSNRGVFVGKDRELRFLGKVELIKVVRSMEKDLPVNELLDGLENDEKLWDTFYNSQYIKERKNHKLFLKQMPKKFHKIANGPERFVISKSRRLDEFIK